MGDDGDRGAAVGDDPTGGSEGPRSTAVRGRVVTYAALLVVAVVAFSGHEAWPLSSFSLFSQVRTGRSISWELVSVDRAGVEHPVALGRDLVVSRGATHLMPVLRHHTKADQVREVTSWLRASGTPLAATRAARIYRVVRRVSTDGRPGRVLRRQLNTTVELPPS